MQGPWKRRARRKTTLLLEVYKKRLISASWTANITTVQTLKKAAHLSVPCSKIQAAQGTNGNLQYYVSSLHPWNKTTWSLFSQCAFRLTKHSASHC